MKYGQNNLACKKSRYSVLKKAYNYRKLIYQLAVLAGVNVYNFASKTYISYAKKPRIHNCFAKNMKTSLFQPIQVYYLLELISNASNLLMHHSNL